MSKASELIETINAWKTKHADENLNLKALDSAMVRLAKSELKAEQLTAQLQAVKDDSKLQASQLAELFTTVKATRKEAKTSAVSPSKPPVKTVTAEPVAKTPRSVRTGKK